MKITRNEILKKKIQKKSISPEKKTETPGISGQLSTGVVVLVFRKKEKNMKGGEKEEERKKLGCNQNQRMMD